jgi:hypothetical protein
MARLARVVIPDLPHQIAQRGNRRQRTFFDDSARTLLPGRDDGCVKVGPLLAMVGDWGAFLQSALSEEKLHDLRQHARTGRPLGSKTLVERLEAMVGRVLTPRSGGRPRKLRMLP